ncbi:MAG: glycerol-3-phosphate dehydrogenase [Phycisphaerales bacterium]|nr:glycerol-3-phosphate dehydrogenase [Phycisphaerales bacterium]
MGDAMNTPGVVDVLVVGGGIVGAGVARDAAMRGLSTVLVDRYDFAFGTSSRSSRLLHGGLRYLAQGRVGLVREASHEKMILARIVPHLARPLPFLFPTYKGSGWSRWKLRLGVKMYDLLCGKSNLGKSGGLSQGGMLEFLPGLRREGLTGGVRYFDGFTNDARLVVDTLRSAEAHGARLLNYTSLASAERGAGVWACRLAGAGGAGGETLMARIVVNAAGAWAEGFPASKVHLRLTKGVHLVIDRVRLPVPDAVVMTDGKRILFAIPWGERVILGTTDSDYDGPTENPTCDAEDMAYVLRIVNRHFPAATIVEGDVISAWAGLRPLIANANGKPSDISRAHEIHVNADGWIDVAGGKLTTYRLMAEQTIDHATRLLAKSDVECRTAEEAIVSADGAAAAFSGVAPPAVSQEAVEHFCRSEWARHLDDVMIRRAGWHYYHRDRAEIAERVAGWMAAALGWSAERTAAELGRYGEMSRSLAPAWLPPTAAMERERLGERPAATPATRAAS